MRTLLKWLIIHTPSISSLHKPRLHFYKYHILHWLGQKIWPLFELLVVLVYSVAFLEFLGVMLFRLVEWLELPLCLLLNDFFNPFYYLIFRNFDYSTFFAFYFDLEKGCSFFAELDSFLSSYILLLKYLLSFLWFLICSWILGAPLASNTKESTLLSPNPLPMEKKLIDLLFSNSYRYFIWLFSFSICKLCWKFSPTAGFSSIFLTSVDRDDCEISKSSIDDF